MGPGSASVRITSVAVSGPALTTVRVNTTSVSGPALAGPLFATEMSAVGGGGSR